MHPPVQEVFFDRSLDAWVLTRHRDVSRALAHPAILPQGAVPDDKSAHGLVRDAVAGMSSRALAAVRTTLAAEARRAMERLPSGEVVDLVQAFARPWAFELAVAATGVPRAVAEEAAPFAAQLFHASAAATSGEPSPAALDSAQALAGRLACRGEVADAAIVQTFVALTETLPYLIAGAWLALLQHPAQLAELRRPPGVTPAAVSELVRFAGPSRVVFRTAMQPVEIGAAVVQPGDRLVLMLQAANRDAERFADPDRLDVRRAGSDHLGFGAGPHRCAGAPMIASILRVATRALLRAFPVIELAHPAERVEWVGGVATCAPHDLPVILHRGSSAAPGQE